MSTATKQRERLPKWAQQELDRLERDLASAYARLSAGPDESNTFADEYSAAPRPLGDSPTIVFKFGDGWGQQFSVRLDGEELVVSGGDSIAIFPRASNSINVKTVRL